MSARRMNFQVGQVVTYSNAGKKALKMAPGFPEERYLAEVVSIEKNTSGHTKTTIKIIGEKKLPGNRDTVVFSTQDAAEDALYFGNDRPAKGGKRSSRKVSKKTKTRKAKKGTYRRRR